MFLLKKKETGKTPKEFILDKRLEKAKELISASNKSLDTISFEIGFNFYSRFSLFFKQKTGYTPKEYRKLSIDSR